MITLRIQILSFVFSFLYGIIVNLLFKCFKKYLYYNNFVYKILNSLLFMIDITLIYFKCFLVISDGYISIYFVIISIVTFVLFDKLFTEKYVNKSGSNCN